MFTAHWNEHKWRWEAHWQGRLFAVAPTEHEIHERIRRWKQ